MAFPLRKTQSAIIPSSLKPSCGSICLHNQTAIPLVYVISHLSPLYWGVLQPSERVQRTPGPFWFTVTTYPFTGDNEPSACGVACSHIRDVCGILFGALWATKLLTTKPCVENKVLNGWAESKWSTWLGGAMVGRMASDMIQRECLGERNGGEWNMVREVGVKGDGQCIHIQGGPKENGRLGKPMFFTRTLEE